MYIYFYTVLFYWISDLELHVMPCLSFSDVRCVSEMARYTMLRCVCAFVALKLNALELCFLIHGPR
jgi:hypothetical protein